MHAIPAKMWQVWPGKPRSCDSLNHVDLDRWEFPNFLSFRLNRYFALLPLTELEPDISRAPRLTTPGSWHLRSTSDSLKSSCQEQTLILFKKNVILTISALNENVTHFERLLLIQCCHCVFTSIFRAASVLGWGIRKSLLCGGYLCQPSGSDGGGEGGCGHQQELMQRGHQVSCLIQPQTAPSAQSPRHLHLCVLCNWISYKYTEVQQWLQVQEWSSTAGCQAAGIGFRTSGQLPFGVRSLSLRDSV